MRSGFEIRVPHFVHFVTFIIISFIIRYLLYGTALEAKLQQSQY